MKLSQIFTYICLPHLPSNLSPYDARKELKSLKVHIQFSTSALMCEDKKENNTLIRNPMTGFQISMFSTAGITSYRKDLDIMHKRIIDITFVRKIMGCPIKNSSWMVEIYFSRICNPPRKLRKASLMHPREKPYQIFFSFCTMPVEIQYWSN